VLDKPLSLLLKNKHIDIKFCINWANETWTRKWDSAHRTVIIKQDYKDDDALRFAEDLIEVIEDRRYIRVDGRPLIMLYRPLLIPDIVRTIDIWRESLTKVGIRDPYIVMPQTPWVVRPQNETRKDPRTGTLGLQGEDNPLTFGVDAAAGFPPHKFGFALPDQRWKINSFDPDFVGRIHSYEEMVKRALDYKPSEFTYLPGVCTDWDNGARLARRGISFYGSTPKKYGQWLRAASLQAKSARSPDERIVFINAWNEWAEGAYLEPDRHYGYAYLAETRRVIEGLQREEATRTNSSASPDADNSGGSQKFTTRPRQYHRAKNFYFGISRRLRGKNVDSE
jgi:hypothetical protein